MTREKKAYVYCPSIHYSLQDYMQVLFQKNYSLGECSLSVEEASKQPVVLIEVSGSTVYLRAAGYFTDFVESIKPKFKEIAFICLTRDAIRWNLEELRKLGYYVDVVESLTSTLPLPCYLTGNKDGNVFWGQNLSALLKDTTFM